MILKVFKEKSNQKIVEKRLSQRKVVADSKKISSVGVLLNHSEFKDYDSIHKYLDDLNINSINRKFFTFSGSGNIEEPNWERIFTAKDFGWSGKLKNPELQNFTETNFDVLICYFLEVTPELKQIAATSKANFKVGISNTDERLFDLIINVTINKFDVFKKVLKKYLTILNKL